MTQDPWAYGGEQPRQQPGGPPPGYGPPPAQGQPGPYGQPAYGYGYGYGPPPPRRRNGWKIFWIVLVIVLLLVGGCAGGIYALYRSQLKVNADKVNEFLGDMKRQDYPAAYDQLCSSQRLLGTSSAFSTAARSARAANHGVQSYNIKQVHTQNTNGFVTRTAGGTVTLTDGSTRTTTFSLGKENGKLCINGGYQSLLFP